MTTFAKSTSRGQITLPIKWRKKFKTSTFSIVTHIDRLEIVPVMISPAPKEDVIFDSERDFNGKSPDIDMFIEALEKSLS